MKGVSQTFREEMLGHISRERFLLRRKYGRRELTKEEIEKICSYLENPTKVGIWTLEAKWANLGGISKPVIDQLKKQFEKEAIAIHGRRRTEKIKFKEEDKIDMIFSTRRLSFVFYLFAYLMNLENQDDRLSKTLRDYPPGDRNIIEILDLDDIKNKYSDAFEYFKKNIYFEGFSPKVDLNKIIDIKEGFFIVGESYLDEFNEFLLRESIIGDAPKISGPQPVILSDLILKSINPEPLEKMKVFYEKINKISDSNIMPIHSPEEEVFIPYFLFLESTFQHFIHYYHSAELLEKSITQYKEANYSDCIGTVGLILEDYLIQIYETLFRDVCPKDLAIGQLFNLIQNKVANKFKRQPEPTPDIKPLYDAINRLVSKSSNNSSVEILKIMRDMLTYVKKSEKGDQNLIDSMRRKEISISIFPKTLINNIKEAIRNRNATSHKSTIPIGNYEALRTVYGYITLVMWWNNEKSLIDWKESQEEILKKLIDKNSKVPQLESS